MMFEGYNGIVGYELVDDSHSIFNIWKVTTVIGEQYCESFYKNEDPNKMLRNKKRIKVGIDLAQGSDVTVICSKEY
ncbi:hypothetical protein MKC85_08785 [[Clostridium] innocuum]|nr:hypothetical protein [[Clostridium] innocuum]